MTSNTTPAQKEILLEYMSRYPSMATNSPTENTGRDNSNKRWETLSAKLNVNGPPIKSVKAWKKTWADYKHRAKKKLSKNKSSINKTGGGPNTEVELTPFEDAVIELAKIKAAVLGISDVKTFCGENTEPSPEKKPAMRSSSSSSLSESEDEVETLLKDLLNENSETTDKRDDIVPISKPNSIPKHIHQGIGQAGIVQEFGKFH